MDSVHYREPERHLVFYNTFSVIKNVNVDFRATCVQKSMHARIREISVKRICSAPGCLKSREGNIIMEKEKIL